MPNKRGWPWSAVYCRVTMYLCLSNVIALLALRRCRREQNQNGRWRERGGGSVTQGLKYSTRKGRRGACFPCQPAADWTQARLKRTCPASVTRTYTPWSDWLYNELLEDTTNLKIMNHPCFLWHRTRAKRMYINTCRTTRYTEKCKCVWAMI